MNFVVFPDHQGVVDLASRLTGKQSRVVPHDSGRPWIIGDWTADELVLTRAGKRRLALLGRTNVSRKLLTERLEKVRSDAEVNTLARDLPGCFHLVHTYGGRVHARGTLAGVYRVYYAQVDGITVGADRPDQLVAMTNASFDERMLPLYLLTPYARPPWPLSERCPWRGVRKVPPGHCLEIDATGTHRTIRWWYPPDPVVPLVEGADLLRDRLLAAMRSRVDRTGAVGLSVDLSGGMDSTSLCYLANHIGIPFTTVHHQSLDPSNQDSAWVRRCHPDLTAARHVVLPPGFLPGAYAESVLSPPAARLEGPTAIIAAPAIAAVAEVAAQAGAGRHVRGNGSDELFRRTLTGTAAMIRQHPLRHWRKALRLRAQGRWTIATTLRHLRNPGSYRDWLLRAAGELTSEPNLCPGWDLPQRMPTWATPEAVAAVRKLYHEAAEADVPPLIPDPGQHEMFRLAQLTGELNRQCTYVGKRYGVDFEVPYVDDQVLEVALSIRNEDRAVPGVNKPVLAEAMRGIVPADVLARSDKSNTARDFYHDLRRNRDRLVELCQNPLLAQRGLIDPQALRSIVLGLHPDLGPLTQLGSTWAAEMWLRALPERVAMAPDSVDTAG